MNWFGVTVGLLNAAAAVQYFLEGRYTLALVWGCYAIAAAALASI